MRASPAPVMQILIDFFPLIAFFVAFTLADIYVATGVLIVAIAVQTGWHYKRTRKVKTMHWVTGLLALVLGLATIILHDARFIQWKLTVLMWAFALAFLVSQFVGERPLIRRVFESASEDRVAIEPRAWSILNFAWVLFFAGVGALNLYVAKHYALATWVNFKVFGVTALTVVFVIAQALWLGTKMQPATDSPSESAPAAADAEKRDA
jgi:intracellular septation protein